MKSFKNFISEQNKLPDYRTVLDYSTSNKLEPIGTFTTARGSTYAHYGDASTVRNRIDDKGGFELQPKSFRTIFMKPEHIKDIGGIHQNTEIPTEFKPTSPNKVGVVHTSDYGPRKAGSLASAEHPYEMRPRVGLAPVEVYDSKHPKGVHFGSRITHISDPSSVGAGLEMLNKGAGGPKLIVNPADELKKFNDT